MLMIAKETEVLIMLGKSDMNVPVTLGITRLVTA